MIKRIVPCTICFLPYYAKLEIMSDLGMNIQNLIHNSEIAGVPLLNNNETKLQQVGKMHL